MEPVTDSREWLRVTLASIGDGVITTDAHGRVSFLNPVAQALTGWSQEQAVGRSLVDVFRIVNQDTRAEVDNPALRSLREGVIVGLANHTLLIARDGTERPIDDSAAPIRNGAGAVAGAVLVFRDITERYRQEQTIRQTLEYARSILETQREPFLVLDKGLRVVSANRAFYEAFKVGKGETEGSYVYELGNGQWDIPRLRELLEDVLPRDHAFDEFRVEHEFPAIGRRTMLLNARRVRKPGNHSELILLAVEDITERERARAELRESEERYRTLVNQVKDFAIFSADLGGRATSWNKGVERILGFGEDEFIGVDITKAIFTPEDVADGAPERELETAAREGVANNDRWMRRKSGDRFFAAGVTTALKDGDGRVVGFSKVFRDVTGTKRLQDAVHDSEVRYRRLFETAKDGILILDARTGKITDANPYVAELIGQPGPAALKGKELWEIGLLKDIGENKELFRRLQSDGYVQYDHLPLRGPGGETVPVEFVSNLYREDGRSVAQCNVRSIADRSLRDRARAMAEESRRKDEFLAMLSHELRNPLAPIRSAVHLLRMRERPGGEDIVQKQAHEVIERQVANLTKIVSDLLEVSRVLSGRVRLEQQAVDLNRVVRHAVETAAPLIGHHRHELALRLSPDPIWASADATRLEEVFINLLNNAAKYTPDGGGIEVWCERVEGDGGDGHARVRVRDNGVGIDKDLLPRLFDLFTQADRSLDRAQGGLGIGLALAHRLVELHGGSIEAKSPPEGGTTGSEFIVKLPLMPAPVAPEPSEPEAHAAKPEGVRVLLVDDNIDLVMMLASTLRSKGYSVQAAYTGPDGLKAAQQWRPDVVLLDIGLPGLDGYEVARRLRSDPALGNAGRQMRLLAVTGYGRDADLALAREAGFDGHLTKPVEFKELERLIGGSQRMF